MNAMEKATLYPQTFASQSRPIFSILSFKNSNFINVYRKDQLSLTRQIFRAGRLADYAVLKYSVK